MKKSVVWFLIMMLVSALLCGCGSLGTTFDYPDEDRYTVGEATVSDPVEYLDLNWYDGQIVFETHKENTIVVSETSKKTLSDKTSLRWWLDGTTLRVQYAASGRLRLSGLNKTLKVVIPEGLQFLKVSLSGISTDIDVENLQADQWMISTVSGNVKGTAKGSGLSVSTISGDVDLILDAPVKEIRVSTVSGPVHVTSQDAAEEIEVDTTSGDITLDISSSTRIKANSISARVSITTHAFSEMEIVSVSGDAEITVPDKPGFTAEITTVSGDVDYAVQMSKEDGKYVCGDGSANLRISTISGDVRINK